MPTRQHSTDYVRHWPYRRDPAPLHRYTPYIRQALPHLLPGQRADLLGALREIVEGGHTAAARGPDAA